MDFVQPMDYAETPERRSSWDRMAGGYIRGNLDRDYFMPQGEFFGLDGAGLVKTALQLYERDNELAILDAGCGTSNQLFSLVEELTEYREIPRNNINAVGVSDIDFSKESEFWMPRAATAEGDITYGIGDLTTETLIPEQFNLIYSYEVMIHNEQPNRIVANLWSALKPGGVLYFNAGINQAEALSSVLEDITSAGGDILFGEARPPLAAQAQADNDPNFEGRNAYRIIKPE